MHERANCFYIDALEFFFELKPYSNARAELRRRGAFTRMLLFSKLRFSRQYLLLFCVTSSQAQAQSNSCKKCSYSPVTNGLFSMVKVMFCDFVKLM